MKAAAVLVVAGVWVLCQVLGGDALGRLGISGAPSDTGKKSTGSTLGDGTSTTPTPPNAPGGGGYRPPGSK